MKSEKVWIPGKSTVLLQNFLGGLETDGGWEWKNLRREGGDALDTPRGMSHPLLLLYLHQSHSRHT